MAGVGIVPKTILSTSPKPNLITLHPFEQASSLVTTELVWSKERITANTRALIDILASQKNLDGNH